MSSRRRLYLNLKQGIVKLFKTPAHYLKELTGKQSIFEKPYLDQDYRQMHLNLPIPRWKRPEFDPGGIWPSAKTRRLTVVFSEEKCFLGVANGECGETISISGSVWYTPPYELGRQYIWNVTSSDPDGAIIESINPFMGGISVQIRVKLGDSFTGTVTICAKVSLSGTTIQEVGYEIPPLAIGGIVKKLVEWTPSFEYARKNLPTLWTKKAVSGSWDCGCVDLEVNCECTGAIWDSATSAETVARNSSCTVAITDGGSGTKTWSVSGTGFWFDAGYTKTTLETAANSVTLYADGTACGSAIITACGATGYVRCTTGNWSAETDICDKGYPSGSSTLSCQIWKKNEGKEYKLYMECYDCGSLGICADTYNCTAAWAEAHWRNCTLACSPPGGGTKWGLIQVTYRTWGC